MKSCQIYVFDNLGVIRLIFFLFKSLLFHLKTVDYIWMRFKITRMDFFLRSKVDFFNSIIIT